MRNLDQGTGTRKAGQAKRQGPRGGDLEITDERTVASIPRGDREELRVTHVRARTIRGETAWLAVRVWYDPGDGVRRPGRAGVTIRLSELAKVREALAGIDVAQDEAGGQAR